MCPACITNAALMVVGLLSTGGLTALVAKTVVARDAGAKNATKDSDSGNLNKRSEDDGNT